MKEEISAAQSLEIINNSLAKTKENLAEHSVGFLFWGWLVTSTSILHYLLITFSSFRHSGYLWLIAMAFGVVFSIIFYAKRERKSQYTTYLDTHLSNIWRSIFIGFAVGIFLSFKLHIAPTALMLTLSGIGTLATGLSMKFKPLIIGAICLFIFAIASMYITDKYNLLINAAGLFTGYIIPGHILRNK